MSHKIQWANISYEDQLRVPQDMVQEMGISSAIVFTLVHWYAVRSDDGVCTISQAEMADILNCAVSTIKRHLKRICDAKYVACTKRYGRGQTNIYAVTIKGWRMAYMYNCQKEHMHA